MKLKTMIAALAVISLSAGCSNSGPTAGAGAGSEANAGADSGTVMSWIKSLSFTKSAKATVTMPAQTLIAQELAKNVADPAAARDINFTSGPPDEYFAEPNIVAAIEFLKMQDPKLLSEKHIVPTREGAIRRRGELAIASALAPTAGWPCDMLAASGPSFFTTPAKAKEAKKCGSNFMSGQEAAMLFSNSIFQRLADKLSPSVLADPDDAAAKIRAEWEAISAQDLLNTWNQAVAQATGTQKTVDLTGFNGTHFMDGQGDFQGTAQGSAMIKNSMPFFGNGYINGKQIMLGLESNVSKSQQKSAATSESSRASAGTGASSSTK